jgi:hypothetical protein
MMETALATVLRSSMAIAVNCCVGHAMRFYVSLRSNRLAGGAMSILRCSSFSDTM